MSNQSTRDPIVTNQAPQKSSILYPAGKFVHPGVKTLQPCGSPCHLLFGTHLEWASSWVVKIAHCFKACKRNSKPTDRNSRLRKSEKKQNLMPEKTRTKPVFKLLNSIYVTSQIYCDLTFVSSFRNACPCGEHSSDSLAHVAGSLYTHTRPPRSRNFDRPLTTFPYPYIYQTLQPVTACHVQVAIFCSPADDKVELSNAVNRWSTTWVNRIVRWLFLSSKPPVVLSRHLVIGEKGSGCAW